MSNGTDNTEPIDQGVIDTKGFLDPFKVNQCKENAGDDQVRLCFSGGMVEENHKIIKGDLLCGVVDQINPFVPAGDSNQLSHACISGESVDAFPSHRAIEEAVFFQGQAMGNIETVPPLDLGTLDGESGVAIKTTGKGGFLNKTDIPWYAGVPMRLAVPDTILLTGERMPAHNPHHASFERSDRWTYILKPIDPTDVRPELIDLHQCINSDFKFAPGQHQTQGMESGVRYLPYAQGDISNPRQKIVSRAQERAYGFSLGAQHAAFVMIQMLLEKGVLTFNAEVVRAAAIVGGAEAFRQVRDIAVNVLKTYETNSNNPTPNRDEYFNRLFLQHQSYVSPTRDDVIRDFSTNSGRNLEDVLNSVPGATDIDGQFAHHMATGQEKQLKSMFGAWHSLSRLAVGTCYTNTNPGEKATVVLGGTRLML